MTNFILNLINDSIIGYSCLSAHKLLNKLLLNAFS